MMFLILTLGGNAMYNDAAAADDVGACDIDEVWGASILVRFSTNPNLKRQDIRGPTS
jgi:hypothetical protein